jgi:hypothetical protein
LLFHLCLPFLLQLLLLSGKTLHQQLGLFLVFLPQSTQLFLVFLL